MADPLDEFAENAVRYIVGKPIVRSVATPTHIEAAFERLYGAPKDGAGVLADEIDSTDRDAADDVERLRDLASEAPVIRLVNSLVDGAVQARASDIHVESEEGGLCVRYRIDGVLQDVDRPPARLRAAIVSRIKIMARLNIAERRLAQDGRIRLAVRGREIDFRVSTTPTMYGESVVMRILDRSSIALDLKALGFDDDLLSTYHDVLRQPHGILLATGPTGSGKTTTLYASLTVLNTRDRKILTIEDPIEYELRGINQLEVRPQIGRTFASALRSFLRQDPDIMMIGEIRDLETAQIAVQAALTGHLILSTLHTNDAASAVTRLLDMGVEDYLLTSTINGIIGQRLVRMLCRNCREPHALLPGLLERLQLQAPSGAEMNFYRERGCSECDGTGFRGRTMIVEFLAMSDAIRQLVLRRADPREIQRVAVDEGMRTMYQHGLWKAAAGITTVDEVLRVVRDF